MRVGSIVGVAAGVVFAIAGFYLVALEQIVTNNLWWALFDSVPPPCSHCTPEPTLAERLLVLSQLALVIVAAGALAARIGPDRSPKRGAVSTFIAGLAFAGLGAINARLYFDPGLLIASLFGVLLFTALGYLGGRFSVRFA